MSDRPQSYESHAILVTGYHKILTPLMLFLLITSIVWAVRDFSFQAVVWIVLILALVMTAYYARVFALGVQDRVIRLEERLRMERVLPDDLKARIGEISTPHLIGLRFAPDEELEGLVREVLDGKHPDRKSVKAAIKNWRPDHQRV